MPVWLASQGSVPNVTPPEAGGWHRAFGFPCAWVCSQSEDAQGFHRGCRSEWGPAASGFVGSVERRQVLSEARERSGAMKHPLRHTSLGGVLLCEEG